jgi:NhaA family Na+:H+ antiporter
MSASTDTQAKLTAPVRLSDHSQGSSQATVTLVEYGDYECQYCGRVHPIIQDLVHRLGQQQVRYVYRHFPIRSVHPHAMLAAEAAEAAGSQGKFWEMHDLLFDAQGALARSDLVGYARQLSLDLTQFEQELDEHVHREMIETSFYNGVRSGVNGTPTFYINGQRYDGAWDLESLLEAVEKPLGIRIRLMAQEFTRIAASGGIVLFIATLLALFLANSVFSETYQHLLETPIAITLGRIGLTEDLLHWINDGLMAIFFFVVGLEIKREITAGELASKRKAILPIAAALGGMIIPALFYLGFNFGGPGESGWGIPMATDIAFTLGIMALLGKRVPLSLKVFFTALAIVDDIGAVLVIAVFYTAHIEWAALAVGMVIFVILLGMNRARVYSPLPYTIFGLLLWLAFLESGIHPTIAGVLLAFTIPTRSPANVGTLLAQGVTILGEYEMPEEALPNSESRHQSAIQTLENIIERLQSPAQRLERLLHPWSTYLILPIFALANAGIVLSAGAELFNPVSLGIIFGLVLGKPIGVTGFSWLAVKFGLAELPTDLRWQQIFSASCLAGIGFTMSIFIANAGFTDPELLTSSKLAILTASVLAGGLGFILLGLANPAHDNATGVSLASSKAAA